MTVHFVKKIQYIFFTIFSCHTNKKKAYKKHEPKKKIYVSSKFKSLKFLTILSMLKARILPTVVFFLLYILKISKIPNLVILKIMQS